MKNTNSFITNSSSMLYLIQTTIFNEEELKQILLEHLNYKDKWYYDYDKDEEIRITIDNEKEFYDKNIEPLVNNMINLIFKDEPMNDVRSVFGKGSSDHCGFYSYFDLLYHFCNIRKKNDNRFAIKNGIYY